MAFRSGERTSVAAHTRALKDTGILRPSHVPNTCRLRADYCPGGFPPVAVPLAVPLPVAVPLAVPSSLVTMLSGVSR